MFIIDKENRINNAGDNEYDIVQIVRKMYPAKTNEYMDKIFAMYFFFVLIMSIK